ncbi:MAG: FlgD immunoglobulin-like domain containing protein [Calditrichia bacterium]
MKLRLLAIIFGMFIIFSAFLMQPSFNGSAPGCSGGSCHTFQSGLVSATPLNNLQVQVTVTGVQAGRAVAGELVDQSGTVVDVINSTTDNPFTLSAPSAGEYTINAGFKSPSREWDSTSVNLGATGINIPSPSRVGSSFELFPNHPNPFNSETIIKFSLPRDAEAELVIFNINGQVVRNLASGHFASGIHTLRWNGKDNTGQTCASGMYLCQIKSGRHTMVRRLIFSK